MKIQPEIIFKMIKNIKRYGVILILLCAALPAYPFGKNKVAYEIYDWRVLKSLHFDIHYPAGMENLAVDTLNIAEEGYLRISGYLCHELTDPVPIIIYPSHIGFQNNNILSGVIGEGTGGFTEALKNRVVVPFNGSMDEFRHVLVHELVHAFQFNILFADTSGVKTSRFSMRGIPLWYVEGMAEYISIGLDETCDMTIRDALYSDYFAGIKELSEYRIPNIYLLYKEGQAFMYFIEKTYGKRAIGDIFRDMRDIDSIDEVFKANTGKNVKEINAEWIKFYKRRYYHLVRDKKFSDEEGAFLADREEAGSRLNLCPAVSPDGNFAAYVSDKDVFPGIVISPIEEKDRAKNTRTILLSGRGGDFEALNVMRNTLTFSPDGKNIFFAAQHDGSDAIYSVAVKTGKIMKRIKLPFRSISRPRLSADGLKLVFSAATAAGTDIYIYDIPAKRIIRLTDDPFEDRDPVFTHDGGTIIFSSNRDPSSRNKYKEFDIYSIDILSGSVSPLVKGFGSAEQPDVSSDGKKMLFVSNRTGIYNAYVYSFEKKEVLMATDILSGAFSPRWVLGGDSFVFVSFFEAGYDIVLKKIKEGDLKRPTESADTEYFIPDRLSHYPGQLEPVFERYAGIPSPDWLFFGMAGAYNYGLVGFVQMSFSDYLSNHRVVLSANYIYQSEANDLNFDLVYFYLKNRWDYGVGAFRYKNPFLIFSLNSINDLIHNVNAGTIYMDHYGGYFIASYPFSRFFRTEFKTTMSRYERDYSHLYDRKDVFANLNQVSASLTYDNVLWGPMVPLDGFRGRVEYEQAVNLTGMDYVYSSLDIDLRKYFFFNKRNVLALRGMGGSIFGRDADYFKYYIGGYNTLRGHNFLDYSGENMFVANAEYRFTFIEGIKMGWPLPLRIGNIGGVLFLDSGAAWDDNITMYDETGRWKDIKAGFGFGFRLVLYPVVVLKLDYAWPFDNKGVGKKDIIFSLGFDY